MKKAIISFGLLVLGLSSAMAQGRQSVGEFLAGYREGKDTVRAAVAGVVDPEFISFDLEENGDTLTVLLGGKRKVVIPEFYALDVRPGDTLTVVGAHKKKPKKGSAQMVFATVLSIDYAVDHDEKIAYNFSLEEDPTFMGGSTSAFSRWVNTCLVYPEASRQAGSAGTVQLRFTIDTNGELTDTEVLKSSGDVLLDSEALRVVKSSPKWEPGKIHGKPAKVRYRFPVIFRLK